MPINTQRLQEIYTFDINSSTHKAWIAVPDSKTALLIIDAGVSSWGTPGTGWKIHISIDPEKMAQAAQCIAKVLQEAQSPRVSMQFAGKQLAQTGQPGKQVAFIFYEQALHNKEKISDFLHKIEIILLAANIGIDPRPINSDIKASQTQYNAVLFDSQGGPSRFSYRNERCIVMDDDVYEDVVGPEGTSSVQGKQIWVKRSYYANLPNSQKHNPGNLDVDPLDAIRVGDLKTSAETQNPKKRSYLSAFFGNKVHQTTTDTPKDSESSYLDRSQKRML